MKKEVYEPREDTFLIEQEVERYTHGRVLDMGTGTGVLAIEAAQKADFVIGVDINKDALEYAKKKAAAMNISNIKFVHSDLFSYFRKNPDRFDLIIFNPPYLPEQEGEEEEIKLQVSGGKRGYEILERFLSEASEFLAPHGRILILFSTLTNVDKVHEILERYAFNYQKLNEEGYDFETLFVYLVEKSSMLKTLEKKGISGVEKIARGHRGVVYSGIYHGKKVAIKKQRPESEAVGRIINEIRWLQFLNRKGIGPKFLFSEDEYFVYNFVEGDFIMDFFEKADRKIIKKVLISVLRQCNMLDKMGINKEEMHHPLKHIIVKNTKAVMIDFERVHASQKPKNVTQFLQFLSSRNVYRILHEKGLKMYKGNWGQTKEQFLRMAKRYKKAVKEAAVKEIRFDSF